MAEILHNDWKDHLSCEFEQPYYRELRSFLIEEYKTRRIFPPMREIYNALHSTPLSSVKVLILGQDPYHDIGQAHGLCFSVRPGVPIPPSLRNIYKELAEDCGCPVPNHGYLQHWAEQGVLLLNTVLTVRAHEANSHRGRGWERFTDAVIRTVNRIDRPVVVILWGRPAQMKKAMLDNPQHLILEAPHPSPLSASRGFFGSAPFSKANAFLTSRGISPIDWCIPDIERER